MPTETDQLIKLHQEAVDRQLARMELARDPEASRSRPADFNASEVEEGYGSIERVNTEVEHQGGEIVRAMDAEAARLRGLTPTDPAVVAREGLILQKATFFGEGVTRQQARGELLPMVQVSLSRGNLVDAEAYLLAATKAGAPSAELQRALDAAKDADPAFPNRAKAAALEVERERFAVDLRLRILVAAKRSAQIAGRGELAATSSIAEKLLRAAQAEVTGEPVTFKAGL